MTYLSKNVNIALSLQPKLTWSVAQKELDYTVIEVIKTAVLTEPVMIDVTIENKIETTFPAANLVGMNVLFF